MQTGACSRCESLLVSQDSTSEEPCPECGAERRSNGSTQADSTVAVDPREGSSLLALALGLDGESPDDDASDAVDLLIDQEVSDLATARSRPGRMGRWQVVVANAERHRVDESAQD